MQLHTPDTMSEYKMQTDIRMLDRNPQLHNKMTDQDVFMDLLQEVIDDLKNKPNKTAVIALVIKNEKSIVFKHLPAEDEEEYIQKLIKAASEAVQ